MPIRIRTLALAAALLIGVAPIAKATDFNAMWPWIYLNITNSGLYNAWITANSGTVYYVQSHTNLWDKCLTNGIAVASNSFAIVKTGPNSFTSYYSTNASVSGSNAWTWIVANSNTITYMAGQTNLWDQALTNGYLSASNNWGIAKVGSRFLLMYSTNAMTLDGHPWADVLAVTNGLPTSALTNGLWIRTEGTNWVDLGYYPRSNPSNYISSYVDTTFTNYVAAGWGLTNSAAANSGSNTLSVYTNELDLFYLGLGATASNAVYAAGAGDSVLFDGYDSLWFVATNHIGPVLLGGPLTVAGVDSANWATNAGPSGGSLYAMSNNLWTAFTPGAGGGDFMADGTVPMTGLLDFGGLGATNISVFWGAGSVVGTNDFAAAGGNTATGGFSHAEGVGSLAAGWASHAEAAGQAYGSGSHSEGGGVANGVQAHAEGSGSANEQDSHAEGSGTLASGASSHAEGSATTASGVGSHSEGLSTIASGPYSHAEGQTTTASGEYSHAEGRETVASGAASHAGGYGATASDVQCYVWSDGTAFGSLGNFSYNIFAAGGFHFWGSSIDVNGFGITNLLDPVAAQDAATKNYVDTAAATYATNTAVANASTNAMVAGQWVPIVVGAGGSGTGDLAKAVADGLYYGIANPSNYVTQTVTNGLVTAAITNGLVTAAVTNGLVTSAVTNGLVTAAVTNGLVTSAVTNGLVTAAVTGGLAAASELYKVKGTGTDVAPNWLVSKILGDMYVTTAPYDNGGHDEWVRIGLDMVVLGAALTNGLVTSSVTNGLVTAAVTNGLVTAAVTNGLVTQALTNGLENAAHAAATYLGIGGTAASAGYTTTGPQTCRFLGTQLSAGQTLTNNTFQKLQFPTPGLLNVGGCFSTNTSTFTTPADGFYQFSAGYNLINVQGTGTVVGFYIYVNGVQRRLSGFGTKAVVTPYSLAGNGTFLETLSSNDTVELYVYHTDIGYRTNSLTWVSGYRIF